MICVFCVLIVRKLLLDHTFMKVSVFCNVSCSWLGVFPVHITVMSSAYAWMCALGMLKELSSELMRIFHNVGDKGLPCGHPLVSFLVRVWLLYLYETVRFVR